VGQKTVKFSDLSGEIIITDDALARIVIHEHPALGGGPVEIETLADEASTIEKGALRVAVVDVHFPGEPEPRRVTMDSDEFDNLATDRPMTELLRTARPARRVSKAAAGGTARPAGGDRVDYGDPVHAGKPHKGKVTDAEKELVQERFDEINDRLAAEGLRTISLADPEHVERYALAGLAAARGAGPG
jgi:hypothetical protein